MKRFCIVVLLVLLSAVAISQNVTDKAEEYISQYSDIAVSEMLRSGVPASITLAQGLLESGCGQSRLAVEGNNHFGIKCHSDWTGDKIFHDDDAKGECFRKYSSADQSFRDHSDFLRFKQRYASLFELPTTDYKSWSYGLKAAGYATDPSYAQKLIANIERYNLSRFDVLDTVVVKDTIPETPVELSRPQRYVSAKHIGAYAVSLHREILQMNGIPFIYARTGETYRTISAQYDLFPKELAGYNDSKDVDKALMAGEMVFLHWKATKATKGLDKHICQEGENLYDISQKYAVKLKSLMKMNGISDKYIVFGEDDTVLLRPVKKVKDEKEK